MGKECQHYRAEAQVGYRDEEQRGASEEHRSKKEAGGDVTAAAEGAGGRHWQDAG